MSISAEVAKRVDAFVREQAASFADARVAAEEARPEWKALVELGTALWLDTGSFEESGALWCDAFGALTTNNTLLNKEVQSGQYDRLVSAAATVLEPFGLTERERLLEIAFILNGVHALRLVARYDAHVSVEEHTDLSTDVEGAVSYGIRYHALCPERFIVKIPFTAEGLIATRRLSDRGIPVNHTLGFSARQNAVVTCLSRPAYVNVFLGRLNSVVADNDIGDGAYVGEKAVAASQSCICTLRAERGLATRQIGASLRSGMQVRDLAGVDVLTMPPKVAGEFLESAGEDRDLAPVKTRTFEPEITDDSAGAATLWAVPDGLAACLDGLEEGGPDSWSADGLYAAFEKHGCSDLLVRWSEDQVALSREEGKIPSLKNWSTDLGAGRIGLDALMNLAGLNAFRSDQQKMDERIQGVLS